MVQFGSWSVENRRERHRMKEAEYGKRMGEQGMLAFVAEENRDQIEWIFIGIALLVIGLFRPELDGIRWQYLVMAAGMGTAYYSKYSVLKRKGISLEGERSNTSLLHLMRGHSFSFHRYFALLRGRMLWFQLAGCVILGAVICVEQDVDTVWCAAFLMAVPVLISFCYEAYAYYRLTHRPGALSMTLVSLTAGAVKFLAEMAAAGCMLFWTLLGTGMVWDFMVGEYDDSLPVRIGGVELPLFYLLLIVTVVFIMVMLTDAGSAVEGLFDIADFLPRLTGKERGVFSGQMNGKEESVFSGQMNGKEESVFSGQMNGKEESVFSGQVNGREESVFSGQVNRKGKTVLFRARMFLGAAVLVLMACSSVVAARNYIQLTEETITVVRHGVSAAYRMEEITHLEVHADESDSLALKVTFEDGSSQEILTGIFSTTDGYDELFYSDYNYGAWLVERLTSQGTACSLSDREILEREVKQLDPECREGFDRMVECILCE